VQGVWQVFILLESPFWGLQRSMPSIVLQTKFLFNNTEKSGFDVGICSVLFWISDSYGDSHLDPNMTLQFYGYRIFKNTVKFNEDDNTQKSSVVHLQPVLRIRDVYPGCRILIFTYPGSRISDPGSKNSNKRER
jgi:hypothetical protein